MDDAAERLEVVEWLSTESLPLLVHELRERGRNVNAARVGRSDKTLISPEAGRRAS